MCGLDELVVDAREIDRELVGTFLKPYLRIDRETCAIMPQPAWTKVSNEARVLLYLVGRKAMRALELNILSEHATPLQIEQATGIPGGSVRPALKRLLKGRFITRESDLGYTVPNFAMLKVRGYVRQSAPDVAA